MKRRSQSDLIRWLNITGYAVIVVGVIFLSVSLFKAIQINDRISQEQSYDLSGAATYSDNTTIKQVDHSATKKVLILASYDPTYIYYQDQIAGMLSVSDANDIEFDVVNLDTFKHHTKTDLALIDKIVEQHLADGHYSGVIALRDPALRYVMDHQDDYFKDLPILFCGVADQKLGRRAAKNPHIAGSAESTHITSTVNMARKLLPGTKRIVAVHDDSDLGKTDAKIFEGLARKKRYAGLDLVTLNTDQYSGKALRKIIASYKKGTIVLAMTAHTDRDGNYYTVAEMVRNLSERASVPIFRSGKGGYSNGAAAGRITLCKTESANTVRLMHQIIDGKVDLAKLRNVPVNTRAVSVVSYPMMKKYHLDFNRLPKSTLLIGAPASYTRRSYWPVLIAMGIILAGALMLLVASRLDVKMRLHTERRLQKLTDHLQFANAHDPLTAVYTRQAAGKRLDELDRQHRPYAVVTTDLDNFKDINKVYGHEASDAQLKDIASELKSLTDACGGVAARYSGDAFLLFFPDRTLQKDDPILHRIQNIFKRRRTIGMDTIQLRASIAAANSNPSSTNKDVLLLCETAMQIGKRRGKNACIVYDERMKQEAAKSEQKRLAVLDAIEHDGLTMVYQPQVETATGKLTGFEALARMKDKTLSPGVFIPIAEANGWIQKIGRITTKMVIRQICVWRNKQLNPPPISINYSIGQLSDADYLTYLKQCLVMYAVPVEAIRLEITESLFIRKEREARAFFEAAHRMGVRFMMDDFGTGYSSLSMLQRLPVEEVKIDKSILDNHCSNSGDPFLKHVIALIHDDGKRALCEGVETQIQRELLKDLHCDLIQGFYFGKPGPAEAAEGVIRKGVLDPEKD
ncbi:EAL domain-containing protein [Pseudoramibacter porci]|nr:EAL domain-containing protein [Pseudoramibacter porci]